MSFKLFQGLISQMKEVIAVEFGIIDESGEILASSDENKVNEIDQQVSKVLQTKSHTVVIDNVAYQKVFIRNKIELITYINANDKENLNYLLMFSINVTNLKVYYDEKFDKGNFIKNIILDNVLPGDILLRARELHLDYNAYRIAFLIRTEKTKEMHAHDIIQGLFPNSTKDFIVILDDENIVLVKELKSADDHKETEKTAKIIIDTLSSEVMLKAFIGIGTIVDSIKDISRTFKEAQMALLVGRIFESDKLVVNYNNLGIGRLIYQIPTTLCELFLKEVFKNNSFDSLDVETMLTIQKFFENNLNVSETSRQLYVHRNTLVYRLDKIQKLTGLDLTKFDDAVIFKVAILVKKYLDKSENLI